MAPRNPNREFLSSDSVLKGKLPGLRQGVAWEIVGPDPESNDPALVVQPDFSQVPQSRRDDLVKKIGSTKRTIR